MNVEFIWSQDGGGVRFLRTEKPVDRVGVWPSMRWSKMSALEFATAQRDLWARRVKKIQAATENDVEEPCEEEGL